MLAAIGDPSGQYATLSGEAGAARASWEVPSLKSKLDTIGGNVAAEAVRRTRSRSDVAGVWIAIATMVVMGGAAAFVWKSATGNRRKRQPGMAEPVAAAPAPKTVGHAAGEGDRAG